MEARHENQRPPPARPTSQRPAKFWGPADGVSQQFTCKLVAREIVVQIRMLTVFLQKGLREKGVTGWFRNRAGSTRLGGLSYVFSFSYFLPWFIANLHLDLAFLRHLNSPPSFPCNWDSRRTNQTHSKYLTGVGEKRKKGECSTFPPSRTKRSSRPYTELVKA